MRSNILSVVPINTNSSLRLQRKEGNILFNDALNTFGRKEWNVLCNDALNTFDLRLYGVRYGKGPLR